METNDLHLQGVQRTIQCIWQRRQIKHGAAGETIEWQHQPIHDQAHLHDQAAIARAAAVPAVATARAAAVAAATDPAAANPHPAHPVM